MSSTFSNTTRDLGRGGGGGSRHGEHNGGGGSGNSSQSATDAATAAASNNTTWGLEATASGQQQHPALPVPSGIRDAESITIPMPDSSSKGPAGAGGGGSGRRKKRADPGSRGVASLTPEQLAKKRANDREAQRAIRERTKNQIELLERRIQELTNQEPYQELQVVVRQKEALERELADVRRQLANVVSMLQPLIGSTTPGLSSSSPIFFPGDQTYSTPNSDICHAAAAVRFAQAAPRPGGAASASSATTPESWTSPCGRDPREIRLPEPALGEMSRICQARRSAGQHQRRELADRFSPPHERLGLPYILGSSHQETSQSTDGSR